MLFFCGLKSALFFCGLDFCMCALFSAVFNKNVVLTSATQKHAVLKMPISHSPKSETSIFCTTHLHWPGNLPLQFALTLSSGCLSTPRQSYPKFRHFSKFSLFGSCTGKSTFSPGPKIPVFQRPRTRRILELQTCKQVLRSTDSVVSSDTLSFAISPKLGEL